MCREIRMLLQSSCVHADGEMEAEGKMCVCVCVDDEALVHSLGVGL